MLTTLSLPSSDHDSSTRETGNNTEPSRFLDHETPWTLSLSPQLTPLSNSIEYASPMSQSQSLSPTSSFGAEIGLGPGEPRFITFPSSPFVSELPSPAYEDAGPNNQPDHLNAADYAAAFMSSTWNTGGERIPEVLETYGDVDSGASVEACASSGDPLEHAHVYETTKLAAVIGKVKRLGGKVKKLLTPRLGTGRKARRVSRIGYEIPTSQSSLTPIDGPRHVISRPDSSLGMNGDDISSNATTALPLPPGLLFRPSLTTQTYTRASATSSQNDNNVVGIQPPAIHICPPGSPGPFQARKCLGPENKELFKRSSESNLDSDPKHFQKSSPKGLSRFHSVYSLPPIIVSPADNCDLPTPAPVLDHFSGKRSRGRRTSLIYQFRTTRQPDTRISKYAPN
ncbi:hypothetical protein BD779DRAFT_29807 [Infundibulicybe gibba]|nr:hypothetical protein BD779DRAFT_29807 [Infundibulicybe gibba]